MKTCSKCGASKDEEEFRRTDGNVCKVCEKEYSKEHHKILVSMYDPDDVRVCTECGFTGKASEFVKCKNLCKRCKSRRDKEYYNTNAEHIKKSTSAYQKTHRCIMNEAHKQWAIRNPEKYMAILQRGREKRGDAKKERLRQYHIDHAEEIRSRVQEWKKQNPGRRKEQLRRQRNARRGLGHNPLNMHFKGADEHHLRYSNSQEDKDNDMTIYAPRELHRSIPHNGNTGKGMREINCLILEWYLNNTPPEEQNKKAVDLYLKYCMLPSPTWISEQTTA